MTPERWSQIKELFGAALETPEAERPRFLESACGGDADLRAEVERLLAGNEEPSWQSPAAQMVTAAPELGPGVTVAHYRILDKLGEGGMGVVYRASDSRLRRSVALKFVKAQFSSRNQREARAVAALNHHNICTLYDVGPNYLVMELIEGPTLAQRMEKGVIPIAESLSIARQIAEALEAAHEKGVVHRDLKPANIKLTPDGAVKVLDFGLAKAQEPAAGSAEASHTQSFSATQPGMIVGTAAYMSPEQARGEMIDKRADIWAFGCVLYELLAHRRPFTGATVSDFIAAILTHEPDWAALQEDVPRTVRTLVKRCLEKDRRKRLRDIGDARLELDEALVAQPGAAEAPDRTSRRVISAVVGAIAGAAIASVVAALLLPSYPGLRVTRFLIALKPDEVVAPIGSSVELSQDGRQIAWATNDVNGRTQIYHRVLDQMKATQLPGTLAGHTPLFSKDGRSLAFFHTASRTVRKLALSGGAASILSNYESSASAGTWTPGGGLLVNIQFPGPLVRVTAQGGDPQPVTKLDEGKEELVHSRPALLPGNKAVLFMVGTRRMETYDDALIAVQSLETGERKTLIEGGMCPAWSSTGHIIYARDGKLLAVPFDVKRLALTGSPVPVLDGVFMCVNTGSAHYSLAGNGTLAYAPGVVLGGARQLVWVDRAGKAEVVPIPAHPYLHPSISPDGKHVAVETEAAAHDFWTYDLDLGILSKVTTDAGSHWPLWTPDGSRYTYRRWVDGAFSMWWMPADRSAPPERLTNIGRMQSASSWSPDGHVVAFTQVSPETGADVFVMDMAADRKPRAFVQTRFSEGSPKFSPDGRWIAYTSNESGRNEIYVQAYPGPGAKVQVSVDGGTDAIWRPKGGELYYRNGDKMLAVQVITAGAFQASRPKVLWTGRYAQGLGSQCGPPGTTSSNYDVTADGERFLMVKQDEIAPAQINVVLNWTEELKHILQTNPR